MIQLHHLSVISCMFSILMILLYCFFLIPSNETPCIYTYMYAEAKKFDDKNPVHPHKLSELLRFWQHHFPSLPLPPDCRSPSGFPSVVTDWFFLMDPLDNSLLLCTTWKCCRSDANQNCYGSMVATCFLSERHLALAWPTFLNCFLNKEYMKPIASRTNHKVSRQLVMGLMTCVHLFIFLSPCWDLRAWNSVCANEIDVTNVQVCIEMC